MNKPQIQTKNGNELITKENTNNKIRKSKFNKFFSTVTAVMIASSIAMGPMTLRGEETETKKDIKKAVQLMEKEIEKINKKIEKTIELIDERIEENNKKIQEKDKKIEKNNQIIEKSKKKIEENNRKMEIEKKKIEEAKKLCLNLNEWLNKADEYCSKNTCTKEENTLISTKKNEFNKNCTELLAQSEKNK